MCVQQRAFLCAPAEGFFYYVPRTDPLPPSLPVAFSHFHGERVGIIWTATILVSSILVLINIKFYLDGCDVILYLFKSNLSSASRSV